MQRPISSAEIATVVIPMAVRRPYSMPKKDWRDQKSNSYVAVTENFPLPGRSWFDMKKIRAP